MGINEDGKAHGALSQGHGKTTVLDTAAQRASKAVGSARGRSQPWPQAPT